MRVDRVRVGWNFISYCTQVESKKKKHFAAPPDDVGEAHQHLRGTRQIMRAHVLFFMLLCTREGSILHLMHPLCTGDFALAIVKCVLSVIRIINDTLLFCV